MYIYIYIYISHGLGWCTYVYTDADAGLANHYIDVIMGAIASQITSLMIVYSTVYSYADQKKISKLRVTGLCAGNSPAAGEFPAQMASNAENVSIDDVIIITFRKKKTLRVELQMFVHKWQ